MRPGTRWSALGLSLVVAATIAAAGHGAAQTPNAAKAADKESTVSGGPRKVIVGTTMYAMWGEYPGLEKRLAQLGGLIDEMAARAKKAYGRSVDICVLPEVAVNGGLPLGPKGATPYEGTVEGYFAAKAREHRTYIVVPMVLEEVMDGKTVATNACVLIDREGNRVGTYRKVHVVSGEESDVLEGGTTPGADFPVFECDFGKVGMQICFDIHYEDGWQTLGKKGAELVIWSTQSPGQIKPALRAWENDYYVLTSTWRNNASLLDPTGHLIKAIVQAKGDERIMVDEIDLEYRLIPWQPKLRNGAILTEEFGGKVGLRYSEAEDGGIFWSNDPAMGIDAMIEAVGGLRMGIMGKVEADRQLQDAARGGPPSLE